MIELTGVGLVILPNPEFGDAIADDVTVNYRRGMDGTRYTFVRSGTVIRQTLTFESLDRNKMFELQSFLKANKGKKIALTDHNAVIRMGYLDDGDDAFTVSRRAAVDGSKGEFGSYTLTFLGE